MCMLQPIAIVPMALLKLLVSLKLSTINCNLLCPLFLPPTSWSYWVTSMLVWALTTPLGIQLLVLMALDSVMKMVNDCWTFVLAII